MLLVPQVIFAADSPGCRPHFDLGQDMLCNYRYVRHSLPKTIIVGIPTFDLDRNLTLNLRCLPRWPTHSPAGAVVSTGCHSFLIGDWLKIFTACFSKGRALLLPTYLSMSEKLCMTFFNKNTNDSLMILILKHTKYSLGNYGLVGIKACTKKTWI